MLPSISFSLSVPRDGALFWETCFLECSYGFPYLSDALQNYERKPKGETSPRDGATCEDMFLLSIVVCTTRAAKTAPDEHHSSIEQQKQYQSKNRESRWLVPTVQMRQI
jgi:hypothetical protein